MPPVLDLLPKLPTELQVMIFSNLGPGTQRILGATCKSLYRVWKMNGFYETAIRFHLDELSLPFSTAFRDIFAKWLDVGGALREAPLFDILFNIRHVTRELNLHVCLKDMDEGERAGMSERSIKYGNRIMEYRTVQGSHQHPNFVDMVGLRDGDDSLSDESDW